MTSYVDDKPENCNHCIYKKDVSSHWDLEDYCSKNKKKIGRIIMDRDCPLEKLEEKDEQSATLR